MSRPTMCQDRSLFSRSGGSIFLANFILLQPLSHVITSTTLLPTQRPADQQNSTSIFLTMHRIGVVFNNSGNSSISLFDELPANSHLIYPFLTLLNPNPISFLLNSSEILKSKSIMWGVFSVRFQPQQAKSPTGKTGFVILIL